MTRGRPKLVLPDRMTDEGAEVRILLAECPGPAYASYTLAAATEAMRLMDAVLWNRLKDPGRFMACGVKSLMGIIKAKGQFQGFRKYPEYSAAIRRNIQDEIDIADDTKDPRSERYAAFIEIAVHIAESNEYRDPSPGKLVAWRTAGSGSPGKGFRFYKTVLGNDFYYQ